MDENCRHINKFIQGIKAANEWTEKYGPRDCDTCQHNTTSEVMIHPCKACRMNHEWRPLPDTVPIVKPEFIYHPFDIDIIKFEKKISTDTPTSVDKINGYTVAVLHKEYVGEPHEEKVTEYECVDCGGIITTQEDDHCLKCGCGTFRVLLDINKQEPVGYTCDCGLSFNYLAGSDGIVSCECGNDIYPENKS